MLLLTKYSQGLHEQFSFNTTMGKLLANYQVAFNLISSRPLIVLSYGFSVWHALVTWQSFIVAHKTITIDHPPDTPAQLDWNNAKLFDVDSPALQNSR